MNRKHARTPIPEDLLPIPCVETEEELDQIDPRS